MEHDPPQGQRPEQHPVVHIRVECGGGCDAEYNHREHDDAADDVIVQEREVWKRRKGRGDHVLVCGRGDDARDRRLQAAVDVRAIDCYCGKPDADDQEERQDHVQVKSGSRGG
eukprot:1896595-Prymnesium_polylepis.2